MLVAARTAAFLPAMQVDLRGPGGWTAVGEVSGQVPAAPSSARAAEVEVTAGSYDQVRLGSATQAVAATVPAGGVEPLLLVVGPGGLETGGAYAGNQDVSLGLAEAGGRYVAFPDFSLTDQHGRPVTRASLAGQDVVLAAFHTTCHETCPLFTGLFLQMQARLPAGTRLVEVTTDPATDTPAVLAAYASRVGARWTFLTGDPAALAAFWQPLEVQLSSGDTHVSTAALVDAHGFLRAVYRGVPDVASVPDPLLVGMSPTGLAELGHGDGWGAAQILDALRAIGGQESRSTFGGRVRDFSLPALGGGRTGPTALGAGPLVINFFASYCPPCRAELPGLAESVAQVPGAHLLLVDVRDDPAQAAALVAAAGVRAPVALDAEGAAAGLYAVTALPTTVFVKADGTIEGTYVGATDPSVLGPHLAALAA